MTVIDDGEVRRKPVISKAPTRKRIILKGLVVVCVAVCSAAGPALRKYSQSSFTGNSLDFEFHEGSSQGDATADFVWRIEFRRLARRAV